MKRTLNSIVADILTKKKDIKLTARELAEIIVKTEREFVAKKVKRTQKTDKALVFQLMSEIGAQYPKMHINFNIAKTTSRPIKYYYKPKAKTAVKAETPAKPTAKTVKVAKAVKTVKPVAKKVAKPTAKKIVKAKTTTKKAK